MTPIDSHAIAIYITGFLAFIFYKLEQLDRRRNAARILIEEIRQADLAIDSIRTSGTINQFISIMPNASWSKFKHLFIKRLDSDDFNSVTNFYTQCVRAEKFLEDLKNVLPNATEEKIRHIQRSLIDIARDHKGNKENYEKEKTLFLEIVHNEPYYFVPGAIVSFLQELVVKIPKLMGNSAVEKLKRIARV